MCNGGDGRASIIHYTASEAVLSVWKRWSGVRRLRKLDLDQRKEQDGYIKQTIIIQTEQDVQCDQWSDWKINQMVHSVVLQFLEPPGCELEQCSQGHVVFQVLDHQDTLTWATHPGEISSSSTQEITCLYPQSPQCLYHHFIDVLGGSSCLQPSNARETLSPESPI